MKPLRPALLAGIAVVSGVLAWAGAKLWDSVGDLPGVPTAAPVVLAVVAVVLLAAAISIRGRLRAQRDREPDAKGVDPLVAARVVVLGQASALVAALAVGVYGGAGVFLLSLLDQPARKTQAVTAGFTVLAGLAVIVAALWIQHICKLPEDHDDPTAPAPR